MKVASLPQRRDGRLIVVSDDLAWYADADHIVPTLQAALDEWERHAPLLETLSVELEHGAIPRRRFHEREACAPLPRVFRWVARSAGGYPGQPDDGVRHNPLVLQGGNDGLRGGRSRIELPDEASNCDIGGEVCVVTGDVPQGATPEDARKAILLVGLVNAVSLRTVAPGGLAPDDLAGCLGSPTFGPAAAISPVFVTPASLGAAWRNGKLHLPLMVDCNGQPVSRTDPADQMAFDFGSIIAHLATTGPIGPGSIICSGIAEQRQAEALAAGAPGTPLLKFGDVVRIEMRDPKGRSIFGAIEQKVVAGAE